MSTRRPPDGDADTETEPFPSMAPAENPPVAATRANAATNRSRRSTSVTRAAVRLSKTFEESDIPKGFFDATGSFASSFVTGEAAARPSANSIGLAFARPPSIGANPLAGAGAVAGSGERKSTGAAAAIPTLPEEDGEERPEKVGDGPACIYTGEPLAAQPFHNGYHFPPKHSSLQSTKLAAVALWNYFITPVGFLVVIYSLNIVAWGGMLFLLLCNAAPAMCTPDCNDINSPRRVWIEIDSQILNALFCVTGLGLAPWRFRDLWFLLQFRLMKRQQALRRLAGIHRGWVRLEGSDQLPVSVGPDNVLASQAHASGPAALPFPSSKVPEAPLSGTRAPATQLWKLDAVIWLMVWNTFFQCCLCGFMWGLDRHDRPSWSTGLFVALACIVAGVGGYVMFLEGKGVKSIEGVPVSERDYERLGRDREQGVWHWNNIKDKELGGKHKAKARESDNGGES